MRDGSRRLPPSGGNSRADALTAELIDGRFRLERELGAGGMGRVFAARDERTGKRVALKELLLPGSDSEQ